ncbi:TetR/AcrR family transcriptional regulator [Actinotalea subterranea]|uniref:TetR/AcrR family transcriptional regulator n=1 Tax=Actinotalea subterranea TaxID=2607497 RepID=UPI0011EBD910|nr:TetR/AcrR family transcriptional regulator [Actinotalea subterranea]
MTSDFPIRRRTRLPADERRRQIIDVATSVIAQRGFWGLSIQDVADSCGLTVNGVLHHVGSKDGMLVAVLDHRDLEDVRALAQILGLPYPTSGWSPEDLTSIASERGIGLAEICAAVMERNAAQPEIVRLYSVLDAESLSPDHPAHDYFTSRQRVTLDGFARLAQPGVDGPALARHLLALMDGLQLQWLRDPQVDLSSAWAQIAAGVPGLS